MFYLTSLLSLAVRMVWRMERVNVQGFSRRGWNRRHVTAQVSSYEGEWTEEHGRERAYYAKEERTATRTALLCISFIADALQCVYHVSVWDMRLFCICLRAASLLPFLPHPLFFLLYRGCFSCGECLRLLYSIILFCTKFSTVLLHSHVHSLSPVIAYLCTPPVFISGII